MYIAFTIFTFVSNVDSLEWKENATPDSICKRVTGKVKNGSIVLFHNDAEQKATDFNKDADKI